jgi:predicted amidohydrolase YtcJ
MPFYSKSSIAILTISLCIVLSSSAQTLQDIGSNLQAAPVVTIFTAKEIITMDPKKPKAEAVAIVNGKVLAVGTQAEVTEVVGQQPMQINRTFANHVIIPGFVAQHDHPILAALTLSRISRTL